MVFKEVLNRFILYVSLFLMIACQLKIDKSKNIDLHISDSLATKILFKKRTARNIKELI